MTSSGVDSAGANPDAECLYELFNIYATWTKGTSVQTKRTSKGQYSYNADIGAIFPAALTKLLQDLQLLDGIPDDLLDAYISDVWLRADQDGDGMLSLTEFIVWFLTEAAVMLPFKHNGLASLSTAPFYNRFVYHMLVEAGAGVRRKASGLQLSQFLRMCRHACITDDEMMARNAVQVALTYASSNRAYSGVEAGHRLQVAQCIHALAFIAGKQEVSLESLLYQIVGNGCFPFDLQRHECNEAFHQRMLVQATRLFLESELEQPLRKSRYECDICGKTHEQWINGDEKLMKGYFQSVGMPYVPHLRIINARNVRAIFHKYNLKYNKGLPQEPALPGPGASRGADPALREEMLQALLARQIEAEALGAGSRQIRGAAAGSRSAREGGAAAPEPEVPVKTLPSRGRGFCCCQLRSISLMEMQTFWQICWDNRTLRRALHDVHGNLTDHRVAAAFTTAASIEGVYSKGLSLGVHDQAVTQAQAKQLRSCAAAIASRSVAVPGRHECHRCETACMDAPGQIMGSRASLTATPGSGVRPSSAPPRATLRGQWSGGVRGAPAPVTFRASPPAAKRFEHRPPVPTLSFPQFLEALRLLAEDLIGHPQVLVSVEMALWSILHDVAVLGCPLPINQKWVRAEIHSRPRLKAQRRGAEGGDPPPAP